MDTKKFLSTILGLEKSVWYIADVDLDIPKETVNVTLRYNALPSFACPHCGATTRHRIHDHKARTWRHKDLCEYITVLSARIPRMRCGSCGRVTQVPVPWADVMLRITHSFETQILNACALMSLSDVQKMYRVSWYTVVGVLTRAIERNRATKSYDHIRHLGVDELAIHKGQRYLTLCYDLDAGEVIWIGAGRDYQTVKQLVGWFGAERFAALESICCDMWDPYIKALKEHIDPSRVVFDKFHIKQHLNTGVDRVRKQENRELAQQGDRALFGTKYLWLKNPCNLTPCQKHTFRDLHRKSLKVGRAYALKESFNHFWDYRSVTWAEGFFRRWYRSAVHCHLEPMKRVAKMLKKYWYGVISYISHPITNATSEGINSKIRVFTKRAYGFRTEKMFENIVYLACGGLDLHPLKSR